MLYASTLFGWTCLSGICIKSRTRDIWSDSGYRWKPFKTNLDLYAWATWRVFKVSKPSFVPWEGLMKQMGGEYDRADNFVQKAKAALRKIQTAYPGLKLSYAKGGLVLHPSLTAIAPVAKQIARNLGVQPA